MCFIRSKQKKNSAGNYPGGTKICDPAHPYRQAPVNWKQRVIALIHLLSPMGNKNTKVDTCFFTRAQTLGMSD